MQQLDAWIRTLAMLIEFGGGLLVVFGCAWGLLRLVVGLGSRTSIVVARLAVADGIVAALGFKTAAPLLKTIQLRSWEAILMFVAMFALRSFVKQALVRETAVLEVPQDHDRGRLAPLKRVGQGLGRNAPGG